MNNDNYWYNIKDDNGNITIEKVVKKQEEVVSNNEVSSVVAPVESKNKKRKSLLLILPIIVILPFIILLLINLMNNNGEKNEEKYRTFMLYMVGSDLESSGSIATFELKDIDGSRIDLENNNVILMVGGSKKWHNFVNEDEIGIYELSKSGFKKVKSYDVSSMGSSNTLSKFIDYTYDKYPSEKYDMIFWNHGLGAVGLEVDELTNDFLDVTELDDVFKNSPFAQNKLELIIFNNCLSGSIHFASIMKNYAEYMVASEEVMYVGAVLDRLNFLEDVKVDNNGYDIGLLYVNKSDSSTKSASKTYGLLDTTLAIIDLSKIDKVETSMNVFFDSLNLDNDYRAISRVRRKIDTYGIEDLSYDTIDLYDLTSDLSNYSNSKAVQSLQNSIKEAVVYNSASNNYSNGLSVYFPYYGTTEYIETHLYLFEKIWSDNYVSFIKDYYYKSNSAKRANRSGGEKQLLLSNEIKYENETISIDLNEKEFDSYQAANIYIFEKNNDTYNLVLKSNQVSLDNNKLIFNDNKILETSDNKIVSSIYEKGIYKVFGKINDSDVVIKVSNNNGIGTVSGVLIDSDEMPIGGLFEYNNENISYYSINYSLLYNEELDEEWKDNKEKTSLENNNNDLNIVSKDLTGYYVLIEMNDENNDSFYSQLTKIK